MKDINIKNIIAKMYSIILSFFFILILSLFVLFGLLLHGIKVDNLYLTHLKIEKLYIKWDKGLIVRANRIYVQKNKSTTASANTSYMHDTFVALHYLGQLSDILKQVYIKDFTFNNTHSIINYNAHKPSFIDITSSQWLLNSVINTKQKNVYIHIIKFINKKLDMHISGNIILQHSNKNLNAKLIVKLSNTPLLLSLRIKKNILSYNLSSKQNITNLQQILHRFTIPNSIAPWIFKNALQVKSVTLHNCQGYINLNNPANAFKQLSLNMDLNKMSYKFDQNLTSIISPRTTLTIQNGIIKIYPHNARFLNQPLQQSWLYINPFGKDPLIGIFILGNLQLTKQLDSFLKYYNIDMPLVQSKAKIHTYIKLILHLNHFHINTHAIFSTKNSLFNYQGHMIHIAKANLTLNNNQMNIKQLTITDKNITKANISGKINFQKQKTDITCKIDKLGYDIDNHKIVLKTSPLILTYTQNPLHAHLSIPSSIWVYRKQLITLHKMYIKIHKNLNQISIPHTMVEMNNHAKFFLSGKINMKKQSGRINLNLIKLNFNSIKLNQLNLPLQFDYNHFITLNSRHVSKWLVDGKNITLGSVSSTLSQNKLFVKPVQISTDNNISATISAKYNLKNKTGNLHIQNFKFHNPMFKQILQNKHSIDLSFTDKNHVLHLNSQKFGTDISFYHDYWEANFKLSKLAHFIAPLQQYNLTHGYLSISSKNNSLFLLHGFINFSYPILIQHGKKIHNYHIQGNYNKRLKMLYLTINHDVNITMRKEVRISSSKTSINIPAVISFFKSHKFKSSTKSKSKSILMTLNHGYLYAGKNRKVLFDHLKVLYTNYIVTALLNYKNATANFKLNPSGHFVLVGSKFNDTFMNHIFTNSELSGGNLSFAVRGYLLNYDGLIEIKGAVLKKYTVLNNILAFLNTIPALTSFSIPKYSTTGLPTKKIYCTFNNNNNLVTLKEIALNSKKINIYGKGTVNLKTKKLDIALNIKTNVASTLSKIPLVGYILFNGKSLSTFLKLTGTINKPKVQTSIAKDIVTAPFNIIKRTFLSPFELVMPKKDFNKFF